MNDQIYTNYLYFETNFGLVLKYSITQLGAKNVWLKYFLDILRHDS